ncbi:hypothetical protein Ssi03_35380 [Sphaerisporangium siamense]|uniref:Uncharacterized protein (TIGR02678 family) n=1 Tax=Sphaerisporangium siamense TaxID=795645 RepID=A0A7W7GA70_9ACTN|nr:DUF2398 family protein [Sphaerisporangium siamense]MBB4701425.1 uncharacterized protein (TIGR02678 family) [Sphaerisporangium siamense]GII85548.1 hypothetical protein Ssi03_35380 [Sphaerisporangium siamense]
MTPARAARDVQPADLGSYQQAVRRVMTCDLITAARPRAGVLDNVLRWADEMARDFRELFGYTLIATTHQVRLVRRLDTLDPTQRSVFARKGRPFDRRRLAYLCLVLASFQRSRIEISLADLVRAFTPSANAIDGLGFDPTVGAHKAAVVDVLDWLVDRGALRLSDGSLESWVRDTENGDALYDIDHEVCGVLFRPARPPQHLTSVAGLLTEPPAPDMSRTAAARRARRLLLEHPVVYYADLTPEVAAALREPGLAEDVARFTGLVVERRAEGVMLADTAGVFTDRPFPGRGGAVNRTAGLLLAKIADLLEDPAHTPVLLPVPSPADEHAALLGRVDAGLPRHGVVAELAWAPDPGPARDEGPAAEAPLVELSVLDVMMDELFDEFGAASFSGVWQHDPRGLLSAALAFLADLSLVRPVPGGVLVLPAAYRYRNIRAALPERPQDDRLPLELPGMTDTSVSDEEPRP